MKQFRLRIKDKVTPWLNADEWSLEDMEQFKEFPNYQIEWREV